MAEVPLHVVVLTARLRSRGIAARLPRRRVQLSVVHRVADARAAVRRRLVDALLVDLAAGDGVWEVLPLVRDLPCTPAFGLHPWRATDAGTIARGLAGGFADILAEGVDDVVLLDLLAAHGYSARFARANAEPPPAFGLRSDLQRRTWQRLVAHGGRPVATGGLAASLGVSREHLSRAFSAGGAPNLKRTIDYVRLLAAATLAKSPALDLRDVARMAGFAGMPQLEAAAQRVLGVGGASLARLRPQDLAGRFVQGHARLHPVEARSRAG